MWRLSVNHFALATTIPPFSTHIHRDGSTHAYGGQGGTAQTFIPDWAAGERITAVTGNSGCDNTNAGYDSS